MSKAVFDHLIKQAYNNNNTMATSGKQGTIKGQVDAEAALYRWMCAYYKQHGKICWSEEVKARTGNKFPYSKASIGHYMKRKWPEIQAAEDGNGGGKRKAADALTDTARVGKKLGLDDEDNDNGDDACKSLFVVCVII